MFCIIVEHEEQKQNKKKHSSPSGLLYCAVKSFFIWNILICFIICNEDDAMFRFHGFADYKTHVCPQLARMATKRLHFILQVMITWDLNVSKPAKISKVLTP